MPSVLKTFVVCLSVLGASAVPARQARITGGHAGIPNIAPYTVSIQNGDSHICNGAIISTTHVLTAASCVGTLPLGTVIAGSQRLDATTSKIAIKNAIRHPDYNDEGVLNDIAVVELATPLTFSNRVAQIDLNRVTVKSGLVTMTTGWGEMNNHVLPTSMQVLYQKSLSYEDCQRHYVDFPEFGHGLICAFVERSQGLCTKDEGSPLVAGKKLIGIATSLLALCHDPLPDIYVDVAHHYDWIQSAMKA